MVSVRFRFALLVALIAWLVAGNMAGAQDLAGTRPNVGGPADEVTVGIGLLDIEGIDNKAQVFNVDLYIEMHWQDPRLAAYVDDTSEYRRYAMDDVWTPRLVILNDRGLKPLLPDAVTVDRQGNVVLRQRMAGLLAVDLDLRRFPFDTQRLPIRIVSYQYSPEELVYSSESVLVARFDELSGGGWTFEGLEPETSVYRLRDDGPGTSLLTFTISAERDARYYIITLALPMTLILFLAWLVHWVPSDLVPPRMGMSSATVFSIIALGISFRLSMPQIAYLTAADQFVLYSTLLLIASLAVTVASTRRVKAGDQEGASRLSRVARWAFPVLYAIALIAVVV